jgi:molecular chaperone HscA
MLTEARVSAGAIINSVTLALAVDSHLISAQEKQSIETEILNLQNVTKAEDATSINKAVEALNHTTEAFAAARMNASVSRALSGKEINTLNL